MLDDQDILKRYFSPDSFEDAPNSWQEWAEGKSDYKPFSLQGYECRENGNMFLEKCNVCGHELIMCKKYGGQCRSNKCLGERTRNGE